MYEEVYIDLIFFANFVMDYVLLRLTGYFLRCSASRKRSAAGALIGSVSACLLLYLPTDSFLPVTILIHSISAVWMVKTGCQIKSKGHLVKAIVALYLTAFLCGGFWDVMLTEKELALKEFLLIAGCSYLIFSGIAAGYEYYRMKKANIYPITLGFGGKVFSCEGLYDTGNLLTDPSTGRPVSITELHRLMPLLSETIVDKLKHIQDKPGELEDMTLRKLCPRFLTYETVGTSKGILLAVTLEDLCIHTPGEEIHVPHPVLAMSLEPSALGKEYQVILNSNLLP